MSAPTLREVLAAHPELTAPDVTAFEEPWQATLFALTVHLHERGVITWPQWAQALGARLTAPADDAHDGAGSEAGGYFEAWAAALTDLLDATGLVPADEVARTQARWHEAAARTPHGLPIDLTTLVTKG